MTKALSMQLYSRITQYLNYLKNLHEGEPARISSTMIADVLGLNDVQVRKDLAGISSGGKPKVGYSVKELIYDIENFLGHNNHSEAALVGAGNLGKALISYENFNKYGFYITAAFDNAPLLIGKEIDGIKVVNASKIENLCSRMKIKIGIITVPSSSAQEICDKLILGGVRAIWNFAPINLKTPENVIVKNEDMAASLAILTKRLEESIIEYGE